MQHTPPVDPIAYGFNYPTLTRPVAGPNAAPLVPPMAPALYSTLLTQYPGMPLSAAPTSPIGHVPRIPPDVPPPHGPAYPALNLPETRMEAHPDDPPSAPPPYSALLKDVMFQGYHSKYTDNIRQNALHPVKLTAGQTPPANGAFGRHAIPELPPGVLAMSLYSCSI